MATMIKDKRTENWKVRIRTQDGKTKTLSTMTSDKKEADRIFRESRLHEIELSAKAGRLTAEGIAHLTAGTRITWKKALLEYEQTIARRQSPLYVRSTILSLKNFARFSGVETKLVTEITEQMCDQFINGKDARKLGWRQNQRGALIAFFKFLNDKGWFRGNPAKLARVNMNELSHEQKEKRERQPFTDEQIAKLLASTEPGQFWYTAIAIARYTGLRLGDVAMLEWECFSVSGKITVWSDKSDKRIHLDIHPELQRAIDAVPPNATPYLFPREREIANDPATRANLSTYFRRVCEKVGIAGHTFHCLRHGYASECARLGITMEHISSNLGHSHPSTTMGYIHK